MKAYLALVCSLLACVGARAQRTELSKLLASDGSAGDWFGLSLSLDSGLAVVGAPNDDYSGKASGGAYLFDVSDPSHPIQLARLVPTDGGSGDHFGHGVALGGGLAAVGAYGDSVHGSGSGSLYVFDVSDPAHPVQIGWFAPADGDEFDNFGARVALSSGTLIVAAPGDDDYAPDAGAAYILDISDPAVPVQVAKLVPSACGPRPVFGCDVDVDGGVAVVGAWGSDDRGRGLVFVFDAASGQELRKLAPWDRRPNQWFGFDVSVRDGIVAAGATGDGDCEYCGAVYLFDAHHGTQLAKIRGDGDEGDSFFGWSVSLDGHTLVAGMASLTSPKARVFDVADPTHPLLIGVLAASDGGIGIGFGNSVAVEDGTALVGAWLDDDNGDSAGAAYIFDAARCSVDFNVDGSVDTRDILAFLNLWTAGGADADWNGDGAIDGTDVLAFIEDWRTGC